MLKSVSLALEYERNKEKRRLEEEKMYRKRRTDENLRKKGKIINKSRIRKTEHIKSRKETY